MDVRNLAFAQIDCLGTQTGRQVSRRRKKREIHERLTFNVSHPASVPYCFEPKKKHVMVWSAQDRSGQIMHN